MTLQLPDIVTIDGHGFFTRSEPPLPPEEFLERPPFRPSRASNCWRGYTSRWEVCEGRFFLESVDGRAVWTDLLEPLFADWITKAAISLPLGGRLRVENRPYSPEYDATLELRIEGGVVSGWRVYRNPCQRRPPWRPGFPWEEVRGRLVEEGLLPEG